LRSKTDLVGSLLGPHISSWYQSPWWLNLADFGQDFVDSSRQVVGRFLDSFLTVICCSLLAEICVTVVGLLVDLDTNSFHTYLLEVRLWFYFLFSHVLTRVRQFSFAVVASV
jgi:hypothetical protein